MRRSYRLTEILRRSAEQTMHAIVRTVFARLSVLDSAKEEEKVASNAPDSEETEVKMSVSTHLPTSTSQDVSETGIENSPGEEKPEKQPVPPTPRDTARSECKHSFNSRVCITRTFFRRTSINPRATPCAHQYPGPQ